MLLQAYFLLCAPILLTAGHWRVHNVGGRTPRNSTAAKRTDNYCNLVRLVQVRRVRKLRCASVSLNHVGALGKPATFELCLNRCG